MHIGAAPSDLFHKQGTWGWPGWAPRMTSKLKPKVSIYRSIVKFNHYQNTLGAWVSFPLCRPRGAHSDEPLTRAQRTITHPLVVTSYKSGQPQVTVPEAGHLGLTDPGKPLEWRQSYSNLQGADRGRRREANRTHPLSLIHLLPVHQQQGWQT